MDSTMTASEVAAFDAAMMCLVGVVRDEAHEDAKAIFSPFRWFCPRSRAREIVDAAFALYQLGRVHSLGEGNYVPSREALTIKAA